MPALGLVLGRLLVAVVAGSSVGDLTPNPGNANDMPWGLGLGKGAASAVVAWPWLLRAPQVGSCLAVAIPVTAAVLTTTWTGATWVSVVVFLTSYAAHSFRLLSKPRGRPTLEVAFAVATLAGIWLPSRAL